MTFPIVFHQRKHVSGLCKALKDRNGKVSGGNTLEKARNLSLKFFMLKIFVYLVVYKNISLNLKLDNEFLKFFPDIMYDDNEFHDCRKALKVSKTQLHSLKIFGNLY